MALASFLCHNTLFYIFTDLEEKEIILFSSKHQTDIVDHCFKVNDAAGHSMLFG